MANRISGSGIHRTCHRHPTDHRRKSARRAADHDVLWRPPLQPHRIDKHIEQNRQRQHRAGGKVHREAHHNDRADRQRDAEAQRRSRLDASGRDRAVARAPHHRVDIAVVPHVDRTARAGSHRDTQHRGERQHRVQMTRGDQQTDQPGEHHQRHHPRLQQRDPVAEFGRLCCDRLAHRISGCAAVPRMCGTAVATTRSTPGSSRPRPSSCPPRAPSR